MHYFCGRCLLDPMTDVATVSSKTLQAGSGIYIKRAVLRASDISRRCCSWSITSPFLTSAVYDNTKRIAVIIKFYQKNFNLARNVMVLDQIMVTKYAIRETLEKQKQHQGPSIAAISNTKLRGFVRFVFEYDGKHFEILSEKDDAHNFEEHHLKLRLWFRGSTSPRALSQYLQNSPAVGIVRVPECIWSIGKTKSWWPPERLSQIMDSVTF